MCHWFDSGSGHDFLLINSMKCGYRRVSSFFVVYKSCKMWVYGPFFGLGVQKALGL